MNLGIIYALLCILMWSFVPLVSRFGQASLDHFQFLFWSNLLSLILVAICMLVARGSDIFKSFRPRKIFYIMWLGFLGCTFYYLCLYYGYAHGQGLEILVMQYSWPLFIILLSSVLLAERLPALSWMAIAVGFMGILLVLTKGNLTGITLSHPDLSFIVAAGAFSFALFSVLSKKLNAEPYTVTTLLFAGGVITATISLFAFSSFAWPQKSELIPVIINGAFINGLSYILWLKALARIPASLSAVIVFLSPVLSAVWIVVFFDETFYPAYAIGLVLVLGAGLVCARGARE